MTDCRVVVVCCRQFCGLLSASVRHIRDRSISSLRSPDLILCCLDGLGVFYKTKRTKISTSASPWIDTTSALRLVWSRNRFLNLTDIYENDLRFSDASYADIAGMTARLASSLWFIELALFSSEKKIGTKSIK